MDANTQDKKNFNDDDFQNLKFISDPKISDKKVYSATREDNGEQVALKKISKKVITKDELYLQYKAMKMFRKSGNSMNYLGVYETKPEFIIVMPFYEKSLRKYLKEKSRLNEEEIRQLFLQINPLLFSMYKQQILHKNLKLTDIFLKFFDKEEYKVIIDSFGSERNPNPKEEEKRNQTIGFIAPEFFLENKSYDARCGLFCIGVIIYKLFTGEYPYGNRYDELYDKFNKCITLQKLPDDIRPKFQTSNIAFKNLVIRLLQVNPELRIHWKHYIEHPFFKGEKKMSYLYYSSKTIVTYAESVNFGDKKSFNLPNRDYVEGSANIPKENNIITDSKNKEMEIDLTNSLNSQNRFKSSNVLPVQNNNLDEDEIHNEVKEKEKEKEIEPVKVDKKLEDSVKANIYANDNLIKNNSSKNVDNPQQQKPKYSSNKDLLQKLLNKDN